MFGVSMHNQIKTYSFTSDFTLGDATAISTKSVWVDIPWVLTILRETQTKMKGMGAPKQAPVPAPLKPPDSGCNRRVQLLELDPQRLLEHFSEVQPVRVWPSPKMILHSWYDLCNIESM